MKIIVEPKVTIVGQSNFADHPDYDIPDDGDDDVRLCSFAAKGCYDSYGKDGRANVKNQETILEHRHGSVLEHFHISLFIEGITRGLSLELNRHRTFNISQRSTRYTAEEDAAIVLDPYYSYLWNKYEMEWNGTKSVSMRRKAVDPDEIHELTAIYQYVHNSHHAIESYRRQVDFLTKINPNGLSGFELRKWCRGKARGLLPHNLETRGTWTNNIRGLRWFIESRSDAHAEPEIRQLADVTVRLLSDKFPVYFGDFEIVDTVDNIPVWVPKYSKV